MQETRDSPFYVGAGRRVRAPETPAFRTRTLQRMRPTGSMSRRVLHRLDGNGGEHFENVAVVVLVGFEQHGAGLAVFGLVLDADEVHLAFVQNSEERERRGDDTERDHIGHASVSFTTVAEYGDLRGLQTQRLARADLECDRVGGHREGGVPIERIDFRLDRTATVADLVPRVARCIGEDGDQQECQDPAHCDFSIGKRNRCGERNRVSGARRRMSGGVPLMVESAPVIGIGWRAAARPFTMRFMRTALLWIALARLSAAADTVWQQDLDTLSTQLPRLHPNPFFHVSRADWTQAVADLRAAMPQLTDVEAMAGLARITAMVGDGHTNLFLTQRNSTFRMLPLQMRWFADGLFIIGAGPQYPRAVGARVVQIGDLPLQAAYDTAGALISHENDSWVREQ